MYRQPTDDPGRHYFSDPEMARRFREQLRNIQRLIDYNNRRILIGLAPVNYPRALVIFPPGKPGIDLAAKLRQDSPEQTEGGQ